MSNNWIKLKVEDFADVVGGGTPSTKNPENFGGSIPWITPRDLSSNLDRYIYRGERSITIKGLKSTSACLLPPRTILLSTRAPVGYLAIAGNELTTNQGFKSLIVHKDHYPDFIYYLLKNDIERLKSFAVGSTFQELSGSTLKKLDYLVPTLIDEQKAIAGILGVFDDKIELNRKMNQTLEAIARAIFKSWFVDFDPVRAKAEGRDTGLPEEIADLFPDSFEDSELRQIPKGWTISTVGEVCEFLYGKALKADGRRPGNIAVMGSNGQVGWHDSFLEKGPGIIVGRKGNPGRITWINQDFFTIDTAFYIVSRVSSVPLTYLKEVLLRLDLYHLSADSAVPGLNRNIAYTVKVLKPSSDILELYDQKVILLYNRINLAEKENLVLREIQNKLLPRLISGEIIIENPISFIKRAI